MRKESNCWKTKLSLNDLE